MATIDLNHLTACLDLLTSDELAQLDVALREKRKILSCGFCTVDVRQHLSTDKQWCFNNEELWAFLQENEEEIENRVGDAAHEVIAEQLPGWCEKMGRPLGNSGEDTEDED